MTHRERRRRRREAARATLGTVASASSYKPKRKKRTRRDRVRLAVGVAAMLSVMVAMLALGPKSAVAGLGDSPEIDPGSIAGAMTLLVGGVLSLTDRIRRA